MDKKWTLIFMGGFALCLAFVTFSSILSGCAGQVPSAATYDLTSTPTRTPTP